MKITAVIIFFIGLVAATTVNHEVWNDDTERLRTYPVRDMVPGYGISPALECLESGQNPRIPRPKAL